MAARAEVIRDHLSQSIQLSQIEKNSVNGSEQMASKPAASIAVPNHKIHDGEEPIYYRLKNIVKSIGARSVIPLLCICVLVVLVSLFVLPYVLDEQTKARESSAKKGARTTKIAIESYATDHQGKFPLDIDDDFKSYFPGGSSDGKLPGQAPYNSFTQNSAWPTVAGPHDDHQYSPPGSQV
jgi:hypothetical protein